MNITNTQFKMYDEDGVPIDLYNPIDFRNDPIITTCEKLAFQAHGEKYIEALFDIPMPAGINPLSKDEILEWGNSAIKFEKSVEKLSHKRGSGRTISVKSDYYEHTPFSAFFSYKSEPPVGRVFTEDQPVGPASRALKAAGTLIAIIEKNGEDSKFVDDLFKFAWGRELGDIRQYITPDAGKTSKRDITKLTRSMTHTLYGFQAEQPSGKIDLGNYRPTTIQDPVYMDYHRISLTLRFVGEWASRYNLKFVPKDGNNKRIMFFAPVMQEMPRLTNNDLRPKMPDLASKESTRIRSLDNIVTNTFKYYTNEIKASTLASKLGIMRVIGSNTGNWTNESLRAMVNSNRVDTVRASMANLNQVESADILKRSINVNRIIINKSVTANFNMSARRALVTTISAFFSSKGNARKAALLMAYADDKHDDFLTSKITRSTYINGLIAALPLNLFVSTLTVLAAGSSSRDDAEVKLVSYIGTICNINAIRTDIELTPSNYFTYAFQEVTDISILMSIIKSAKNDYRTSEQMSSAITFRPLPTDDVSDIILDAVNQYMIRKTKYWVNHYSARVSQASEKLKDAGNMIEVDKVYLKKVSISYSYLAIVYKVVNFEYNEKVVLSYRIDPVAYQEALLKSMFNFIRKRKSKIEFEENKNKEEFVNFKRNNWIKTENIGVINAHVDAAFKPIEKYQDMWQLAKKRLNVTVHSATKTINRRLNGIFDTEKLADATDKLNMESSLSDMETREFFLWNLDDDETDKDIEVVNKEIIDPVKVADLPIIEDLKEEVDAVLSEPEELDLLALLTQEPKIIRETHINLILELQDRVDSNVTPYTISKALLSDISDLKRYPYDGSYEEYNRIIDEKTIVLTKFIKNPLANVSTITNDII